MRIESLISSGSIKRILASAHIYFRDIGVNLQHRAWGVNHETFINVNGISMANSPHTLAENLAQRDLKSDVKKLVGWLASLLSCY